MSLLVPFRPLHRGVRYSLGDKSLKQYQTTWVNVDNPRVARDIARHGAIGQTIQAGVAFHQNDDGVIEHGGKVTTRATGLTLDVSSVNFKRANGATGSNPADTVTLGAADATNPRIDAVAVDTTSGDVVVIAGTATAGANSTNLSGKPTLPANRIGLAYVIVPATATDLTQDAVVDVRP